MLDHLLMEKLRKHHVESYYHSLRVSQLCFQVAQKTGMDLDNCIAALRTGLLHDIGKLHVPEVILSKRGPLTTDEYHIVQTHVSSGVQILDGLKYESSIIEGVEGHHERDDGSGYPTGCKNQSEISRIVAVCDVYDAMTEKREYKVAMDKSYIILEMERGNLGSLHLEFVKVLKSIVKKEIISNQLVISCEMHKGIVG